MQHLNNDLINITSEHKNTVVKGVEFTGTMHGLRDTNERLRLDIRNLETEMNGVRQELNQTKIQRDEHATLLGTKERQITELKSMLLEFERINDQVESKMNNMKRKDLDNESEIKELKNQLIHLESESKHQLIK